MQRWNNKASEGETKSLDAELRCRLWWRWWMWCTWWVKNAWMHARVLTNKKILFTQGKQRTRTRTKTRQANLKCVCEHTKKILLNQDDKNKSKNKTSHSSESDSESARKSLGMQGGRCCSAWARNHLA